MKIVVYVEGPSDRLALEQLLGPLIDSARGSGVAVNLHPLRGKDGVLKEAPILGAARLATRPDDWVFVLPDLYPMARFEKTGFAHSSPDELKGRLMALFERAAGRHRIPHAVRSRFRPHCLKHDLEALVLAVPDELRRRLGTSDKLGEAWRKPVEDQNDERPPKRVVEDLFRKYRRKRGYVETQDAPAILQPNLLETIRKACFQCFGPFVEDLERAIESGPS